MKSIDYFEDYAGNLCVLEDGAPWRPLVGIAECLLGLTPVAAAVAAASRVVCAEEMQPPAPGDARLFDCGHSREDFVAVLEKGKIKKRCRVCRAAYQKAFRDRRRAALPQRMPHATCVRLVAMALLPCRPFVVAKAHAISKSAVQRALDALEHDGLVTWRPVEGYGGQYRTYALRPGVARPDAAVLQAAVDELARCEARRVELRRGQGGA